MHEQAREAEGREAVRLDRHLHLALPASRHGDRGDARHALERARDAVLREAPQGVEVPARLLLGERDDDCERNYGEGEAALLDFSEVDRLAPGQFETDAGAREDLFQDLTWYALERLYQATESWRDLIEILHRKLDHAQAAEGADYLRRIAEIHEVMLEEPDEAIAAHLEILDRNADLVGRNIDDIARERGRITDADFAAVRLAGYSDAQIVEIVQHVALNVWTNYFNNVFQTEIDFPVVTSMRKAA